MVTLGCVQSGLATDSGFVWIGRPGDELQRIVLRSFEVLNHLEGSVGMDFQLSG